MPTNKTVTERATPGPDEPSRQALNGLDNNCENAKQASGAESKTDTASDNPIGSTDNDVTSTPPPNKLRLKIPSQVNWIVRRRTTTSDVEILLTACNTEFKEHTSQITKEVGEHLESFIAARETASGPGRLTRMLSVGGLMDLLHVNDDAVSIYAPLMKLIQERHGNKDNNPPVFAHESEVYESIQALMAFINDNAASVVASASNPAPRTAVNDNDNNNDNRNSDDAEDASVDLPQLHRFNYYMGDLPMPEDSQPEKWMNMAVMLPDDTPPYGSETENGSTNQPKHGHMLGIVEARCSAVEKEDALKHMVAFSECLFTCRPDRKFVWGFMVCDSVVYACVIILDFVIISEPMDISTLEGRRRFVSLMVSMAFADRPHLGYDDTIRYDHYASQWEIDVLDSKSEANHTFRVVKQMDFASLTCNNLKTLQCTRYQGSYSDISGAADNEYVFVKDVWSIIAGSRSGNYCDEVYLTRKVSEKLKEDSQLDGTYPTLLSGGIVRSPKHFGNGDSLDLALTNLIPKEEYVHKRMAMAPFASPIEQLKSFDELIVAAADVMTAHMAVAQKCNILHRDISPGNIMFTRREDGSVRGLLIDFDHSIDNSRSCEKNGDQIGTGQYMSIRTLEKYDIKRTTLDDWEAMFYVLCWEATFGLKRERDDATPEFQDMLQIREWLAGHMSVESQFKRGHMDSLRNFSSLIASHFYPGNGYEHTKALLTEMYLCIFQNKNMSPLGRGALKLDPSVFHHFQNEACQCKSDGSKFYDSDDTDPEHDAIYRRSSCSEQISSELLEIIQRARVAALERIKLVEGSD